MVKSEITNTPECRLDFRLKKLENEQAIFCLRAILITGKISENDMEAILNFMEALRVF